MIEICETNLIQKDLHRIHPNKTNLYSSSLNWIYIFQTWLKLCVLAAALAAAVDEKTFYNHVNSLPHFFGFFLK